MTRADDRKLGHPCVLVLTAALLAADLALPGREPGQIGAGPAEETGKMPPLYFETTVLTTSASATGGDLGWKPTGPLTSR